MCGDGNMNAYARGSLLHEVYHMSFSVTYPFSDKDLFLPNLHIHVSLKLLTPAVKQLIRNHINQAFPPGSKVCAYIEENLQKAFPEFALLSLAEIYDHLVSICYNWRMNPVTSKHLLRVIEGMSGEGALSMASLAEGWLTKSFDQKWNVLHDINCCGGLRHFTLALCATVQFALQHHGVECKSYVWVHRGTSKRNRENIEGFKSSGRAQCVINAEHTRPRISHCLVLGDILEVIGVVEQPKTSVLNFCPDFVDTLSTVGCPEDKGVATCLSAFGAKTPKDLKLFGTRLSEDWLQDLARATVHTGEVLCEKNGKWTVGKKDELSQSEAYTPECGAEYIAAYKRWLLAMGEL